MKIFFLKKKLIFYARSKHRKIFSAENIFKEIDFSENIFNENYITEPKLPHSPHLWHQVFYTLLNTINNPPNCTKFILYRQVSYMLATTHMKQLSPNMREFSKLKSSFRILMSTSLDNMRCLLLFSRLYSQCSNMWNTSKSIINNNTTVRKRHITKFQYPFFKKPITVNKLNDMSIPAYI